MTRGYISKMLMLTVLFSCFIQGVHSQSACGPQLLPVARACTGDLAEGNEIYYDSGMYKDGDCTCEFNSTSRTLQVFPVVQPPLDLCGSKININIGSDSPFFGQQETLSCLSGNVVLDTSLYSSGTVSVQSTGDTSANNEFCLKFEGTIGDLVTMKCKPRDTTTTGKSEMDVAMAPAEVTSSSTVSKVTIKPLVETGVRENSEMGITDKVQPISESDIHTYNVDTEMKGLTTMFPGAFGSNKELPLVIEPMSDFEFLEYLNQTLTDTKKPSQNEPSNNTTDLNTTSSITVTPSAGVAESETPSGMLVSPTSGLPTVSSVSERIVSSSSLESTASRIEELPSSTVPNDNTWSISTDMETVASSSVEPSSSSILTSPIKPTQVMDVPQTTESSLSSAVEVSSVKDLSPSSESLDSSPVMSFPSLASTTAGEIISSSMIESSSHQTVKVTNILESSESSLYLTSDVSTTHISLTPTAILSSNGVNVSPQTSSSISNTVQSESTAVMDKPVPSTSVIRDSIMPSANQPDVVKNILSTQVMDSTVLSTVKDSELISSSQIVNPAPDVDFLDLVLSSSIEPVVINPTYSSEVKSSVSSSASLSVEPVVGSEFKTSTLETSSDIYEASTSTAEIETSSPTSLITNPTTIANYMKADSTHSVEVSKISAVTTEASSSSISEMDAIISKKSSHSTLANTPTPVPESSFSSLSILPAVSSSDVEYKTNIETASVKPAATFDYVTSSSPTSSLSEIAHSIDILAPSTSSKEPLFSSSSSEVLPLQASASTEAFRSMIGETASEAGKLLVESMSTMTTSSSSVNGPMSETGLSSMSPAETDQMSTVVSSTQIIPSLSLHDSLVMSADQVVSYTSSDLISSSSILPLITEMPVFQEQATPSLSSSMNEQIGSTMSDSQSSAVSSSQVFATTYYSSTDKPSSSHSELLSSESESLIMPSSSSQFVPTETSMKTEDFQSSVVFGPTSLFDLVGNIKRAELAKSTETAPTSSTQSLDHSRIRFIEKTTASITTKESPSSDATIQETTTAGLSLSDLELLKDFIFTDSLTTKKSLTDLPESTTTEAKTTEAITIQEETSEATTATETTKASARTTEAVFVPITPRAIIPVHADHGPDHGLDHPHRASGHLIPTAVIENIGDVGRVDSAGVPKKDISTKKNNLLKTYEHDHEQLDKDTITVIVIGSIIGVVVFIAVIVILITFLKARKGSGELPESNNKDLEMNGTTKGVDNPLMQMEQETSTNIPPPKTEEPTAKTNGHVDSAAENSKASENGGAGLSPKEDSVQENSSQQNTNSNSTS